MFHEGELGAWKAIYEGEEEYERRLKIEGETGTRCGERPERHIEK